MIRPRTENSIISADELNEDVILYEGTIIHLVYQGDDLDKSWINSNEYILTYISSNKSMGLVNISRHTSQRGFMMFVIPILDSRNFIGIYLKQLVELADLHSVLIEI